MKNVARKVSFSLVIPAYNEAHRIRPSLVSIVRTLPRMFSTWEVVVVDDGSTDATSDVITSFAQKHPHFTLIRRQHHGKGAAVRAGMLAAQGTIVGFSDADLATPLRFVRPMRTSLEQGYDIAIASRALPASKSTSTQSTIRKMLGYGFGWFVKRTLIANIYDTQCGLKLFRGEAVRHLFQHLSSPGPLFDMELLVLAARRGLGIIEVPVEWRHHPETRLAYTPLSSLQLLIDLWRIRRKYGILRPVTVRKLPRR